jgi:hypothetical protein
MGRRGELKRRGKREEEKWEKCMEKRRKGRSRE